MQVCGNIVLSSYCCVRTQLIKGSVIHWQVALGFIRNMLRRKPLISVSDLPWPLPDFLLLFALVVDYDASCNSPFFSQKLLLVMVFYHFNRTPAKIVPQCLRLKILWPALCWGYWNSFEVSNEDSISPFLILVELLKFQGCL